MKKKIQKNSNKRPQLYYSQLKFFNKRNTENFLKIKIQSPNQK